MRNICWPTLEIFEQASTIPCIASRLDLLKSGFRRIRNCLPNLPNGCFDFYVQALLHLQGMSFSVLTTVAIRNDVARLQSKANECSACSMAKCVRKTGDKLIHVAEVIPRAAQRWLTHLPSPSSMKSTVDPQSSNRTKTRVRSSQTNSSQTNSSHRVLSDTNAREPLELAIYLF